MTTTDTHTPGITPEALHALTLVGRRVSLPLSGRMGTVLTVDGPDWTAVQATDGTATLVFHKGYVRRYEVPVAEVKWDRPLMGLTLMGVDVSEIRRGVSLVKQTDHARPQGRTQWEINETSLPG